MHVVVTGANGFIGKQLVHSLLHTNRRDGNRWPLTRLTVIDLTLDNIAPHPLINRVVGNFADAASLSQALQTPADLVFHLAAVPSGRSESDPDLAYTVNVQGTLQLLNALKAQGNCPSLVFASSIAVYGKPQVSLVTDDTLPTPTLTYGAHKVIAETLINDYSRRGWIKGCSLRLPGIVTRPPEPNGAVSIFLSNLIRELRHERAFLCPTSPSARTWLMSVRCCIDNLLHAAQHEFSTRRTFMLPPQYVELRALVQAIANEYSIANMHELISWQKDDWVEFNFGSYPPVQLPEAAAAGFCSDKDLRSLVVESLT